MRELITEYRSTKEILESVMKNVSKKSNSFEYKTVFTEEEDMNNIKMFYCIKKVNSTNIYEIKVTMKKRSNDRIVSNGIVKNRDTIKSEFMSLLKPVFENIFEDVQFNDGNLVIADTNHDYVVTLIRKNNLKW